MRIVLQGGKGRQARPSLFPPPALQRLWPLPVPTNANRMKSSEGTEEEDEEGW